MGGVSRKARGTAVRPRALYERNELIRLRLAACGGEVLMKTNERAVSGVAMAVALTFGVTLAAGAQNIEVHDDGSNVSHNASGASNVRMERNNGREAALSGDGQGNQEIHRGRNNVPDRSRTHGQNKGGKDSYGGDSYNGDSYGGDSYGGQMAGYVDPASQSWQPEAIADASAAPVAAMPAAPVIPAGGSPTNPVRLPNTGTGPLDLAGLIAALGAGSVGSAMLAVVHRRR